jgi:hypothetical protein
MGNLTLKEESIIEDLWTAVEQWNACDGKGGGLAKKCQRCPLVIYNYDPRHGAEFYQCLKMVIELIHEEAFE